MKVLTVLGTRPEIIRLSRVISKLDNVCDHVLVHTGQNYDPQLDEIFFRQLKIRQPNQHLGARGSFTQQVGKILTGIEEVIAEENPDRFLVLGDTNSALSSIVAKRFSVPVFHMEAGNRCYDDRVPEEINRRLVDHTSDVLLPYTERSRTNLIREGIANNRIYVTGNPIYEVLRHYEQPIRTSAILQRLALKPQKYFLVTMHRAENVDVPGRLKNITTALNLLQNEYQIPVIVSTHPHTRMKMQEFNITAENDEVRFVDPFGFFDFVKLEQEALCVLSDSGTVQEECAIFRVPNVTIRDVSERPETIESGSTMLSGAGIENIRECVQIVLSMEPSWMPPPEYIVDNVSDKIVKVILSYLR